MRMMDAVTGLQKANGIDEIAGCLSRFAAQAGFEYWHIARPLFAESTLAKRKVIAAWPDAWMQQYDQERLARDDVIHQSFKRLLRPFRWSDIPITCKRADRVMDIAASDFRMRNGYCIPYVGLSGYQGGVSFATQDAHIAPDRALALDVVAIFAFNRLNESRSATRSEILTARQREVLQWIAAGKSAWDTAGILRISEETVRTITKAAMARLNVHSRAQAVAEALRLGEIGP